MKSYLSIPLIIVIDVAVFMAAGYSYIFDSLFWSMLIKFLLAFLWGVVLFRFFKDDFGFLLALLFMLFLIIYFLYPFSKNDLYYRLPANSFIVTGLLSGYYWAKIGRVGRVIVPLLIIAFGYVNLSFIYPRLVSSSESGGKSALVGKSIDEFLTGTRLQPDTAYAGNPFPKGKVYLLEFYFDRCPPCRMKHPALQRIAAMTDKQDFEIVYVDNGKIDKVDDFYKRRSATEKQYYDSAALFTRKLGIKNFPFEVIVDKAGIIRYVSKGYDKDKQDVYVNETISKIKALQ
ncbi:TlpA family protein disulfide reductase [Pseudoflavitalea sp. X16]|uniref:TlpA family protein disulfide reductase n=1 Tax=Paraflavitalea devenefica TaxID=2716334 RepID=UPI00141F1A84|nr:TlpA disulfide reductase family protein [Paraflavitalea devenefica]NII29016.1 TlpA family protein disulfide reductase [Paraflavitalea devenefica]